MDRESVDFILVMVVIVFIAILFGINYNSKVNNYIKKCNDAGGVIIEQPDNLKCVDLKEIKLT